MTGLLIPKGTSFAEFLERRHLTTTTVLFPPSHRPNWPQPGIPKSPPIPRALRSLAVTTHRHPEPRRSPTSCASRPPGVAPTRIVMRNTRIATRNAKIVGTVARSFAGACATAQIIAQALRKPSELCQHRAAPARKFPELASDAQS